jgi:CheY-like chemotaxis protein
MKKVILYAEDDPDDFGLFKETLEEITDEYELHRANTGEDVILYFELEQVMPSLIILDMNMPVMDGRTTLRWLRHNKPEYNDLVIVFTTSTQPKDMEFCNKFHCDVITKPSSLDSLKSIIRQMLEVEKRNSAKAAS